jgi:hypothetical protein
MLSPVYPIFFQNGFNKTETVFHLLFTDQSVDLFKNFWRRLFHQLGCHKDTNPTASQTTD